MTQFEILIIIFIYLFFYGYTTAIFIKNVKNIWLIAALMFASFVIAIYAPLFIGSAIFEKLNNKNL